ncbi:hypothetical protein Emag_005723 [Eimeria magna]
MQRGKHRTGFSTDVQKINLFRWKFPNRPLIKCPPAAAMDFRGPPPSSAGEFMYASEGCLNGSSAKSWIAAPCEQRRASVPKRWWLICLSALAFFMVSICQQSLGTSSLKGVPLRRLGEGEDDGDDDLPRSPSPDFAEFCYALGQWTPQVSLPGEPRASPDLVQAVLASLEAESESGEGAASSLSAPAASYSVEAFTSGTVFRPVIHEGSPDEGEISGLGWKVERWGSPPSVEQTMSSSELVALGDERVSQGDQTAFLQPSVASTLVGPSYTGIGVAPQPTASFSSVRVLEEGASTSAARPGTASKPESVLPRKHPFVRLPVLKPGVEPPQFSPWQLKFSGSVSREHCAILRIIRELLLKSELSLDDANRLVSNSEELAKHAYAKMTFDLTNATPTKAVEALSRRFMVFWSLYSASQVLRQGWTSQPWWQELAEMVPSRYWLEEHEWSRQALKFNYRLIADLDNAIEQLKRGQPLADHVVIDLKRRIFCSPHSPSRLKAASWDPWRDDCQTPSE